MQGIGHIYGVTELTCWLLRILVNVIQLVLIQSLYTIWKNEDLMDKRLQELTGVSIGPEGASPINSQYYQNNGYDVSVDQLDGSLKR